MFSQNNNAASVSCSSLITTSNKTNASAGSSPLEAAATSSSTGASNLQNFFPQLFFPQLIPSSSSSASCSSSSSAFVSSSTPLFNRSSFPISLTSALNRTDFSPTIINGQQQNLNGDGNNGGGGLFGGGSSCSSSSILPPTTHQFNSLQQFQQNNNNNILFQRQQQHQQMQQNLQNLTNQQQQHRHSPKLNNIFQQQHQQQLAASQTTTNGFIDNNTQQHQLWLNLLSAIALGHGTNNNNTTIQNASTSEFNQQHQQGTIAAEKKLERDIEGNALCPACHEPIGKDSTQWAKHLDMEREKLQKAIQCLREKTTTTKTDFNINLHNTNLYRKNNNNISSINNEHEALLDKIKNNQRRRMEAKIDSHFFNHITSTTSAPCTTDDSVDSINTNNLNNNVLDENRIETSSNSDQMEWKQPSLPSKYDCKNEAETFTTKNEINEDVSEQSTTTCFSCQRIADCLVLHVRSRMVRCLECFQQQEKQQQQSWSNNNNNNECQNGFINNSSVVLEGLQQNIENKKKRISPPFSALELASSPGELFGGTKRTRVENEQ